ncbi:MAG: nitrogenase iron-molybdenum cofactor biosynthesis protein NifN [Aquificaceae bacterium]
MAEVKVSEKACSVYPLKLSQPLGAVYALLGIKDSMPIVHGSQGCAAFIKTFLTRHFSENIPIQTTALSEIATVLGRDDELHIALKTIMEKHNPELVGVITTGVSETRGDDVESSIKRFKEIYTDYTYKKIVCVSTPDYQGSFHDGYRKALLSLVKGLVVQPYRKNHGYVNLLVSYALTAKDIDTLREVIESFGLKPIILPDLSSMDGACKGFSSITPDGTELKKIETMSSSMVTIAVGESTKEAGEYLEKKFMIPMFFFNSLLGLENFDRFLKLLMNISGKEPSMNLKRWRNRLLDAMVDGHFYLTGKRLAVAGEPDIVYAIVDLLVRELGVEIPIAVVPTNSEHIRSLPIGHIMLGDLEDILLSEVENIDLLLGNTNLRHVANKMKAPHYRVGIPIFDKLGHFLKGYIGYEGTANLLFELSNLLMERDEEMSYEVPEHIKGRKA